MKIPFYSKHSKCICTYKKMRLAKKNSADKSYFLGFSQTLFLQYSTLAKEDLLLYLLFYKYKK